MTKVINIADRLKTKEKPIETFTIKTIKDSNISVNFKATSENLSLFLGLAYKQLLFAREELQTQLKKKNAMQVEYWRTILKTFATLHAKLIQIGQEAYELTFMEFDCLIGALEVELQEESIKRIMHLPTEDDVYIKQVKELYNQLLPLYDKKRNEATKKSCLT